MPKIHQTVHILKCISMYENTVIIIVSYEPMENMVTLQLPSFNKIKRGS